MSEINPLKKFYRGVNTYIKIPSRGSFYEPGVIEFNDELELGIMPMTAQDELTLKNPDALLTGQAVVDVIKSCVPGAKNPRKLLSCDIDAIMIGIRSASYGEEATLTSKCPACKTQNTFGLNLSMLLNTAETLDDHYEIVLENGVTIFVTPGTFEMIVKNQRTAFENSKLEKAIANPDLSDDEKMRIIAVAFEKLTKLNFELIIANIVKIIYTDENGLNEVTNRKHIDDFIRNVTGSEVNKIEKRMLEINKMGIVQTLDAVCSKCNHTWKAPIEFNPVNFS
jgi:hypothetical protein